MKMVKKSNSRLQRQTKTIANLIRVKRAALKAISAAAVKAKLLANQEEDQIRQLAAFFIEKQVNLITKQALILLLIVDFGSSTLCLVVSICCSCISWKPS